MQYALKKGFSGAKTFTLKAGKTTRTVLKSLKAKKRCYRTVKGRKYWSAWSAPASKATK